MIACGLFSKVLGHDAAYFWGPGRAHMQVLWAYRAFVAFGESGSGFRFLGCDTFWPPPSLLPTFSREHKMNPSLSDARIKVSSSYEPADSIGFGECKYIVLG